MRRFIVLLLSVTMCLSLSLPASATTINMQSSEISIKDMFEEASMSCKTRSSRTSFTTCSTEITAEDGSTYNVALFEYTPATVYDGISYTKTYVYSTQAEYVTPKANGNTQTNTGWDDSISVYGYITITYNSRPFSSGSNITEYLLTKVSGGWERSDSSVSMSNRFVAYTCQYIFALAQVTWKYPGSNTFSYNTGYSTYVPDDGATAVLGAQCSVDLTRGPYSQWTLTTQANVFVNSIGDLI